MTTIETTPGTETLVAVRPRRTWLRALLIDGVLLLIVFAIVEIGLQVWLPQYRNHVFDQQFTAGHAIELNDDGFRGPLVPIEKQPGEFRILALGDSVTFGTGVGARQTWPFAAARELEERGGGHVAVVNTAIPATSLREMAFALESEWLAYEPDAVVLALSPNMVSLAWIRRDQPPRMPRNGYLESSDDSALGQWKTWGNRQMRKLCLPTFLLTNSEIAMYWLGLATHEIDKPRAPFGAMLAHGWHQADLPQERIEAAYALFERDLAALRDLSVNHGVPLVVTYIPTRFTVWDDWRDNAKRVPRSRLTIDPAERVRGVCSAMQAPYVELADPLRAGRVGIQGQEGRFAPLYTPGDYMHFDADGHAIAGRAIADEIERLQSPRVDTSLPETP